jgi:hypothetical protein
LAEKNNIVSCPRCDAPLIQEELDDHTCFKGLDDMFLDSDGTFSLDGKKWYKWFPPTRNEQQNRTTEGETEPKII